jgi:hypothetical protein
MRTLFFTRADAHDQCSREAECPFFGTKLSARCRLYVCFRDRSIGLQATDLGSIAVYSPGWNSAGPVIDAKLEEARTFALGQGLADNGTTEGDIN